MNTRELTYWVEDRGDGTIRDLARTGTGGLAQLWSTSQERWVDAPDVIGDIAWHTGGREGWFRIPESHVESAKEQLRNPKGHNDRQPVFLVSTEGLTRDEMKQATHQALSIAQERGIVPPILEPDGPPTSDA